MNIYQSLVEAKANGEKKFAMLIDPDKVRMGQIDRLVKVAVDAHVDFFFVGGSLIVNDNLDQCLSEIRHQCDVPLVLFPGDSYQLSYRADAMLFITHLRKKCGIAHRQACDHCSLSKGKSIGGFILWIYADRWRRADHCVLYE